MRHLQPFLVIVLTIFTSAAVHACGHDSDCKIGERIYRIKMPENTAAKPGAIIFNHGYRGSAAGIMKNDNLIKAVNGLGLALVAPKSAYQDWDIPNSPSQKPGTSEYPYFERLKADLVEKHGIDPGRIMITGFSAGGMMTWELACRRGNLFAAYAPIAGTFWNPVPPSCQTLPQPIIHMHGTSDRIVPLKGRIIGDTKQGDVYEALALAAPKDSYGKWNSMGEEVGLTCQQRSRTQKDFLQFCVHPGGHNVRAAWVVRAWKEFEKAGVL